MRLLPALALLAALAFPQSHRTQVVMLGAGNPNADPDRSGPAAAVLVNGHAYLVDAGPGVVRRANAAARAGHPELLPQALTRVFITHLHSDHTLGLPDLILTPWVLGRRQSLTAYGPQGLQAMTSALLQAWADDIQIRSTGLEHLDPAAARVDVHEILPGVIFRDANVTVSAFAVHHGAWPEALGYRFQTADRVIVFSGDTTPVATVAAACNGCDLLFHEVYNRPGLAAREPDQLPYFADYHTSAQELGALARQAHPKLLILYHEVFEGRSPADLLTQVRAAYSGPVVAAADLTLY